MSLRDGELNLDTGMNWVERAQELAFSNLGRPSVSNLMVRLISYFVYEL